MKPISEEGRFEIKKSNECANRAAPVVELLAVVDKNILLDSPGAANDNGDITSS